MKKNTLLLLLFSWIISFNAAAQYRFREGEIFINQIRSPFQEDSTRIYTLSTGLKAADSAIVILILPVEKQSDRYRYGSGIAEVQKLMKAGLLKRGLLFIQPEFSRTPWYVNHPANQQVQQESYLLTVMETIRRQLAAHSPAFYLLGFSKSGWGSMRLLLRHPELIDGIFIWDSPLSAAYTPGWQMEEVFANESYFTDSCRLELSLNRHHATIQEHTMVIGGYDFFRESSLAFLNQLTARGLRYIHDDRLAFPHAWDKGWIYRLLRYGKGITEKAEP